MEFQETVILKVREFRVFIQDSAHMVEFTWTGLEESMIMMIQIETLI